MSLNILLAGLKLFGIGTPHTAKGATKHTQFLNGVRAIDCSYMVYQAVARTKGVSFALRIPFDPNLILNL